MKKVKKILAFLLAAVMVLAMGITAFATETGNNPAEKEYTYELYQIFTGDFSEDILSNVKWGKNGTGTEGEFVADSILNELTAANSKSDAEKLDVIKKYVDLESGVYTTDIPAKNVVGNKTIYTYSNLLNGYYLVRDKEGSIIGNDVYTTYVVQVVDGTLMFERKGDVPTTDKKIVEGDTKVDANEASIGDTINYEITGTLPSNFDDYKEYYYVFTDTLSKGLTYKESINENTNTDEGIKVYVKNTSGNKIDVSSYFYKNVGDYDSTSGTTITIGIQDLKALNLLNNITLTKDTDIVITYSATLNEDAVVAGAGNENDVVLKYSNNPNDSGKGSTTPPPENPKEPKPEHPTGETPKDEVVTYTTELTITKTDEKSNILTGAEFTLTGESVNMVVITGEVYVKDVNGVCWKLKDGTYTTTPPTTTGGEDDNSGDYADLNIKYSKVVKATVTGEGQVSKSVSAYVDDKGKVTFTGLGAGTYTITETRTPAGYNTIDPITFTLSFKYDNNTGKFESDNKDIAVGADNKLSTTIKNISGSTLPSTGGIGTTIFYILGGILVAVAAILLITRKRMSIEK